MKISIFKPKRGKRLNCGFVQLQIIKGRKPQPFFYIPRHIIKHFKAEKGDIFKCCVSNNGQEIRLIPILDND